MFGSRRHAQVVKGTVCKTVMRRFESAWRLHSFLPRVARPSAMSRKHDLAKADPTGPLGFSDPPDLLIEIEGFKGSLGALFMCVKDQKIDLLGVPLAPICEAYFSYILQAGGQDIESSATAMAALAYLLERKAWLLVPRPEEEAPEEPEDLVRPEPWIHEFRPAIEALKALRDERTQVFFRAADTVHPYELPFDAGDVTVQDLALALKRLLAKANPEPPQSLNKPRRSLSDQMVEVMKALSEAPLRLDELIPGPFTRSEAVWWFLALLELIRLGQAGLKLDEQDVVFFRRMSS